jgi:hypothetical protein
MEIGYSVPTLLHGIIKQAQEIASESRWMEHYAHCQQNADQIYMLDNCVENIENALIEIKRNIEILKSEDM